jgi:hypothetical protein
MVVVSNRRVLLKKFLSSEKVYESSSSLRVYRGGFYPVPSDRSTNSTS